MKLVAFEQNGHHGVGLLEAGGRVRPYRLEGSHASLGVAAVVAAHVEGRKVELEDVSLALAPEAFRAPFPKPRRNIFCVGKNYFEHAHEFAGSGFDSSAASGILPEAPIIFSKVPDCVTGPGDPILVDATVSGAIDYEAELCVVIGQGGRGIRKADAMRHIWGYTIINDVTARDIQGRLKQWLVGKSQDSFCPMGPIAVTADEIDLDNTSIRCWVNDELRQNANTRDLIFDVPTLIETLSAGLTLKTGDLIATGTPAGVGIGFQPPKYLKPGDRIAIEIDGLGRLENVVAKFRDC